MLRRTLILGLLVAIASGCHKGGAPHTGPTPLSLCAPPAAKATVGYPAEQSGVESFCFDGVTNATDAPRSYRQTDVVRVVVTNANPFLYEYEIRAAGQRVSEASIADFFKVSLGITLPTIPAPPAPDGGKAAQELVNTMALAGMVQFCSPDALGVAAQLGQDLARQRGVHAAIGGGLEQLAAYARVQEDEFNDFRRVFLDPSKPAVDVQRAAKSAAATLKATADLLNAEAPPLAGRLRQFTSDVATLSKEAQQAASVNAGCPDIVSVSVDARAIAQDTTRFQAHLAIVEKKARDLDEAWSKLSPTADSDHEFYTTSILRRFDAPTDVTVTIGRRPAGSTATFASVASQRINVGGGPRFSLSAGFGWSTLGTHTFGTARQFVTPPAGAAGDTVILTVVRTENSGDRVFPFAAFNTRLSPREWRFNPVLVAGVGVTRATDDPSPGYLFGLGVDAFSRRLQLTGGALFTEQDRLAGGLRPGDRLPGSQSQAPVEKRMVGKLMLGVSYRIF